MPLPFLPLGGSGGRHGAGGTVSSPGDRHTLFHLKSRVWRNGIVSPEPEAPNSELTAGAGRGGAEAGARVAVWWGRRRPRVAVFGKTRALKPDGSSESRLLQS